MKITLHGRPVPKARPRPGARGRFYVPSQAEQEALALVMAKYRGTYGREEKLAVFIEFHFAGGRRPGDLDNLAKLVLDALQDAGVYPNDLQVTELHARIVQPSERDQTVVEVTAI